MRPMKFLKTLVVAAGLTAVTAIGAFAAPAPKTNAKAQKRNTPVAQTMKKHGKSLKSHRRASHKLARRTKRNK